MTSPLPRSLATLGYLGSAPPAGGIAAQAFAVVAAYALHSSGGFPLFLVATVVLAVAATWSIREVLRNPAGLEDRTVVIDVLPGQWIALLPLSFGLWWMGAPPHVFPWPGWVGAFLFFRLLLVWRPGPVRWAGSLPGATGEVLDDVTAGALTALAVTFSAAVAHGWLV